MSNYGGRVTINNTTISGNTARNGGGIISCSGAYGESSVTINNSTISGNIANRGGGVSNNGYSCGFYSRGPSNLFLNNSLIAGNQAAVAPEIENDTVVRTLPFVVPTPSPRTTSTCLGLMAMRVSPALHPGRPTSCPAFASANPGSSEKQRRPDSDPCSSRRQSGDRCGQSKWLPGQCRHAFAHRPAGFSPTG